MKLVFGNKYCGNKLGEISQHFHSANEEFCSFTTFEKLKSNKTVF